MLVRVTTLQGSPPGLQTCAVSTATTSRLLNRTKTPRCRRCRCSSSGCSCSTTYGHLCINSPRSKPFCAACPCFRCSFVSCDPIMHCIMRDSLFCITRDTQPVGVMCLHLAKLLVLGRLLQFVARKKAGNITNVHRSTRCVITLVILGDMVRRTSHIPHPPSPIPPPPPSPRSASSAISSQAPASSPPSPKLQQQQTPTPQVRNLRYCY